LAWQSSLLLRIVHCKLSVHGTSFVLPGFSRQILMTACLESGSSRRLEELLLGDNFEVIDKNRY
ncbi:MAG: hypothetical protein ACPGKV_17975, partial [Alteromonas macleodii]